MRLGSDPSTGIISKRSMPIFMTSALSVNGKTGRCSASCFAETFFLQTEWSQKEHDEAIREVTETVTPAVPFDKLQPVSMSAVIKRLDQFDLEDGAKDTSVKTQKNTLGGCWGIPGIREHE